MSKSEANIILETLRCRIHDNPPSNVAQWARLLDKHEDNVPARDYVVTHSPYKSAESLRVAAVRASRKIARRCIAELIGPNATELHRIAAFQVAARVGIENELKGTDAAWTLDRAVRVEAARHQYLARQDRIDHPDGEFDSAKRWYPSEIEQCDCCANVREPSRQWPYSLMKHCRSRAHVAVLYSVTTKELR